MKNLLLLIILLCPICSRSQSIQDISDLKIAVNHGFSEILNLLYPISQKFQNDYLMFLHCNETDSTIIGMAIGDFNAELKIFKMNIDSTGLHTEHTKIHQKEILNFISGCTIESKSSGTPFFGMKPGRFIYVDPIQIKQWSYLVYCKTDQSNSTIYPKLRKIELLKYGPIIPSWDNEKTDDITKLLFYCFAISANCIE